MKVNHQGDCVHFEIDGIDESKLGQAKKAKLNDDGTLTLLEGEGPHLHVLKEPETFDAWHVGKLSSGVDRFLVKIKKDTQLEHIHKQTKQLSKEHDSQHLPAGFRIVNGQKQVDLHGTIQRMLD